MRYGIFGDVHGNLEALEAVIAAMEEDGVEKYLCLGDLVGYGANPGECVDRIRELEAVTVIGNHDYAVLDLLDISEFNMYAQEAIFFSQKALSAAQLKWLKELPLTADVDERLTLFHGTLDQPEQFHYLEVVEDAELSFELLETPVGFFGHTHVPLVVEEDEETIGVVEADEVELEEGCRYLVNPGSVGQPRDGIPDAAYGLYDDATDTVTIYRVEYDIETAQQKIRDAHLPEFLAERLAGGW